MWTALALSFTADVRMALTVIFLEDRYVFLKEGSAVGVEYALVPTVRDNFLPPRPINAQVSHCLFCFTLKLSGTDNKLFYYS